MARGAPAAPRWRGQPTHWIAYEGAGPVHTRSRSQGPRRVTQEDQRVRETQKDRAIRLALVFLNLVLALVAYRALLTLRVSHGLSMELESWMFVADDSSPVLIVGMSAWLLIRRWRRIRRMPAAVGAASIVGCIVLMLLALGAASWSFYTRSADLLVVSVLCMAPAAALLLRGASGARAVLLPAFFLLFALRIPAPLLNDLAFRLQLWTADYAGFLLFAFGLPALVAADQILRADQAFQVIETCSGLRSMETLSMLALLMVDLFHRRGWHATLLFLSAPIVAFALNGVRVLLLIINPHSGIAAVHNLQGVGILLSGLIVLYLLDGGLEKAGDAIRARRAARIDRGRAAEAGKEVAPHPERPASPRTRRSWRPILVIGLPASVLVLSMTVPAYEVPSRAPGAIYANIPRRIGNWEAVDLPQDRDFLGTIAMQESLLRSYQQQPGTPDIELYVGLGNHRRETRGPLSPKTRIPGSGWITEEVREINLGDPGIVVEERIVRSNARRRLVYHWIEGTDGYVDEVWRSLVALDQSSWRRPRESVVVRLSTPLEVARGDPREKARARLERFYRELRGDLDALDRQLTWKRFSGFS